MLQSNPKCRHSKGLPLGTCSFCSSTFPSKLVDICYNYVNNHLETICERDLLLTDTVGKVKLKENVYLPEEICERLLSIRSESAEKVNPSFVNMFKDLCHTRLKRVRIRESDITDVDLEILLKHRLVELDLSYCSRLSLQSMQKIAEYANNMQSLTIGENCGIYAIDYYDPKVYSVNMEAMLNPLAPTLRKLCLKSLHMQCEEFFVLLFKNFVNLTHLDLSNCKTVSNFSLVTNLSNLTSLVLYNVDDIEKKIPEICHLRNLRHLDISQSKEESGSYEDGPKSLASIVKNLPRLVSLDISGTNLAGRGSAGIRFGEFVSDIPGMSSRINNPLQYLGLYETSHDACLRHHIPAKLIAGNANEEQILIAALAFIDRTEMLQKVLNELFHLFRFESCEYVGQALNIVLTAMNYHVQERHIQISGSATLFYIVKGTISEIHRAISVKRKIITTLLNAMSRHMNDDTMMRNGCLTLCQFRIPQDVLFEYERLVQILLHSVHGMQQESFVQRIGIYLLNSLACQVDGEQKEKLGQLGAINKMIWLIADRLTRNVCDDVLEVAWSTMWNVTDETPSNCRKFLENRGMAYFLECLAKFNDKEELLRNMMGLLGNVAEVRELRHFLIRSKYLSVFSDLLDSLSDGIEVSYNAAGVISHIASDGPDVWNVAEPSRPYVLGKMVNAIDRWDLNSQRNINYRSFEPILYLVKVYHTPECQRWAVWALANLTKVYPEKYCALIEKEGGLELLQELLQHPAPPKAIKLLASIVLENCKRYSEQERHLDGVTHIPGEMKASED